MNTLTETALKYRAMGLSIIPLGNIFINEDGSKTVEYPISWTKYQKELATEEEINHWFEVRKYKNIGCISGNLSGIFVLDVDTYKKEYNPENLKSLNIPPRACKRRGRGGTQYFFSYHGELKSGVNLFPAIDIRANGGMVIIAPSVTSTGGKYEWIISPEEEVCAPFPKVIEEHLKKKQNSPLRLNDVLGVKKGERDTSMTSFAGLLMYAKPPHTWASEVWPAMKIANKTYEPPLSQIELKKIFDSIAGTELKSRGEKAIILPSYTPATPFKDFIAQDYPKERYIVEPFFEHGTLNMISAPPNTWKSWVLFHFALGITRGSTVISKFKTEKSSVMIINEEDSPRLIQNRFKLLGLTPEDSDLPIYLRIALGTKITKEVVASILEECAQKNIQVVIFDSLRAVHDADENDSTEMQRVLDLMKEFTRKEITVIFTHHHRKKGMFERSGNEAESYRGSSAINAAISGHMSLEEENRDTGKFLVIKHLKSKAGEKLEPFEVRIEKSAEGIMRFSYEGDYKSGEKKFMQAQTLISEKLKSDMRWITVKEFIELGVASKNVVRAVLSALREEGVVEAKTRKTLADSGVIVHGEGKSNELCYFWNGKKENVLESEEEVF